MKEIKLVITEPYFACPSWLEENRGINAVTLTGQCSLAEVDVALYCVLGYNSIPLTDTPEGSLGLLMAEMERQESVVSGGLMFRDENCVILPGCCCGLEGWRKVIEDIRQGIVPWLGHDPFRDCIFKDDFVTICSDSLEECTSEDREARLQELVRISFTRAELEAFFSKLEQDMTDFIYGPLKLRINQLVPEITERFLSAWDFCFGNCE